MFIFAIVDSVFLSLVIIGGGFLCKSIANVNPHNGIGYRTKLSKKNADTWKEANTYGGNVLIICGAVYFVLTLISAVVFHNNFNGVMAVVLSIGIGIVPVILIGVFISEIYLRNIFDSEGNRK
ncbi:SdpI family protein [Clostridium sp. WILCCON 0269]|uniref:SdpI family protein n=1 Tax=Candidatus Clostridium eludens TaxID=3381663 RepID=A0ABW8SKJ3_9CLOT